MENGGEPGQPALRYGLDPAGIGSLAQRTFILCGVTSILQALWGHRLPLMEGPAGLWFGVFCLILGIGIREFTKFKLENREMCIIGTSLLVAVGVMFLPQRVFNALPAVFRYLLLNGLVVGVLLAILLEQVLSPMK
jgi:xanthine/uracil permease